MEARKKGVEEEEEEFERKGRWKTKGEGVAKDEKEFESEGY